MIDNITATKFFDEIRAHFGTQADPGQAIEIDFRYFINSDGTPSIGAFDSNNEKSKPFIFAIAFRRTPKSWRNDTSAFSTPYTFLVISRALARFEEIEYDLSVEEQ